MKRRSLSVLLCLVLIFSVCPKTAFAAGVTEITITPDQSEVYIGDTITYTISIGAVERMQGFEFKIVIPEGLTYNEGSYHVTDGLRKIFGSEKAHFTEASKIFIVYGGGCYISASPTQIMTFTCTAAAVGDYTVRMTGVDMSNPEYETVEWAPEEPSCTVTVKEKSPVNPSEDPINEPVQIEESARTSSKTEKPVAASTKPEKTATTSSEPEKPATASSEAKKSEAESSKTGKPATASPETKKSEAESSKTGKPETTLSEIEESTAAYSKTEKSMASLSETEESATAISESEESTIGTGEVESLEIESGKAGEADESDDGDNGLSVFFMGLIGVFIVGAAGFMYYKKKKGNE